MVLAKKRCCQVLVVLVILCNSVYLLLANSSAPITSINSRIGNATDWVLNHPKFGYQQLLNKTIASVGPWKAQNNGFNVVFNANEYPLNYTQGMRAINQLLAQLVEVEPMVPEFNDSDYNRDLNADNKLIEKGELPPTSYILQQYLQVPEDKVEVLKQTHNKVMQILDTIDSDLIKPNTFGGRGVVMTGGGRYMPMVLTVIKWIRRTDVDIPIEVFMENKSEYEQDICERLLPSVNAECRVLSDIYGDNITMKLKSKYALKPLSILASKFDHVFFVDADSYPLESIDFVFNSKLYASTGYLLNSDYWPRYISPHWYDIVGRKLGGRVRGDGSNRDAVLLQSDRENAVPGMSTESGQLFVHKSTHLKSLLLATYYNIYGPGIYFPLLTQRGPGSGDKDTFVPAAEICGEKYYQTRAHPETLGYMLNGEFHGVGIVQPDYTSDWRQYVQQYKLGETPPQPRPFALHANYLKGNPKYMFTDMENNYRVPKLRKQRLLGDLSTVQQKLQTSDDIELLLFHTMEEMTCGWVLAGRHTLRDWAQENVQDLCLNLRQHVSWLAQSPLNNNTG